MTGKSPVSGLTPEQYRAMTAISKVSDDMFALLKDKVREVMTENGEDAQDPLLALRVVQAAYGVESNATKEWERAVKS